MTDREPGISVVVPAFNRAGLLPEALDSVLAQDWPDLEVIIVDDGSTDETPAVLVRYADQHPRVVRVIRQTNAGASRARNVGIRAASRPFVALLDSDNSWAPGKLRLQMRMFAEDSALDFCFTGYRNFGNVPRRSILLPAWEPTREYALERLLEGCCINTSTVIFKTALRDRLPLFDESLRCCEDLDLWLRVAAAGCRINYVPEVLANYRVHGAGLSSDLLRVSRDAEIVIRKLFGSALLPPAYRARDRFYLARCYLNSACRAIDAGDGPVARSALSRAVLTRPASARPGWLRVYLQSFLTAYFSGTRSREK